ncbi:MarR family winged helix-turn-helix transcriptional regulator [Microbacterium sp. G2-8]|uniref:MarR family winged helix-turn-helix transcriptional regulator n=1 Tax=Microbacterium sp. G2-8 TaxID=2842454 RepID=UPI001C891341|nr:MarR family transcriptional regulator [Microbacterium sp. G2-8]
MTEPQGHEHDAIRALEAEFSDLLARFRTIIHDTAERVSPGLMPGSYKIFTLIDRHGPLTASSIAEMLRVDKGHLSRMVRELESLELVVRTPDPDDGRAHLLSATDSGREKLEEARAGRDSSLELTLSRWPLSDIERLTQLIHALTNDEVPPVE